MVQTVRYTHLLEYASRANAIQASVARSDVTTDEMRRAVEALAALGAEALKDLFQSVEGIAALMIALHPDIKRGRRPRKR